MSIGAMKLALEQMDAALWRARAAAVRTSDHHIQIGHAIDAFYRLKEAIEQAQKQEPDYNTTSDTRLMEMLTDEQYFEIGQRHWLPSNKIEQIHKEIEEAAHGIKE